MEEKANIYAELDGLQENEIRARTKAGIWRDEKRRFAELYLEDKAMARATAARAEEVAVARSAKDAAWASAKAAKGANTRATWAIGVSIASVLIAAAGLVVAIVALLKKVS
jgi:hypothetical protein